MAHEHNGVVSHVNSVHGEIHVHGEMPCCNLLPCIWASSGLMQSLTQSIIWFVVDQKACCIMFVLSLAPSPATLQYHCGKCQ